MNLFATLTPSKTPVELRHGVSFTTYFMVITTEEEAAEFNAAVGDVAQVETIHAPNALQNYSPDDLARYCIQPLTLAEAPTGQTLESYAWAADDDTITVTGTYAPTVVPVPPVVSRMQAQLALAGYPSPTGIEGRVLLDDVEAAIAGQPRQIQIYWKEVSELHRDHPLIGSITGSMGMSSDQVDALFIAASQIT